MWTFNTVLKEDSSVIPIAYSKAKLSAAAHPEDVLAPLFCKMLEVFLCWEFCML